MGNFKTIRSWESKGYKADPDIFHALCVISIFCNGTSYFIFVFFLFFFSFRPTWMHFMTTSWNRTSVGLLNRLLVFRYIFFLLFLATSDWYSQVSQKLPNASLIFTD